MSTQTEFDKEQTRILVDVYRMGWNDRDTKVFDTSISSIAQAIEESKQAVDKYVIGEDVLPTNKRSVNWTDNNLKAEQRLALWGDK